MKNVLIVIAIILIVVLMFKGDKWQGWYYPEGCLSCEDQYIHSPTFKSLEECRDWANDIKVKRNHPTDDYECGKNCKSKGGFNVCETTTK